MKFTLATKQQMTQFFAEDGSVFAATILSCTPLTVTQVKTLETDGYEALQVATGETKKERKTKSELGHTKGVAHKLTREFRVSPGDIVVGATIDADVFQKGDMVKVTSISKGKGFQGVMKLHGFKGGWGQHGQKHSAREAGSIGSTGQQRVDRGKKMPGRMGSDSITQKNLEILDVDTKEGFVLVKGAVAGKRGTLVTIVANN